MRCLGLVVNPHKYRGDCPTNSDVICGVVMSEENKVSPFYCGTQYADWTGSNCNRCKKAAPLYGDSTCEIELALHIALMSDGEVTQEIADRMGFTANQDKDVWMCPEVDWTEEWKAEVLARRNAKVKT